MYEGFDPARQGLREALCTLGNGYFVTRGALPEAKADGVNYPGTYVAGLYNRLTTELQAGRWRTIGGNARLAIAGIPNRRRSTVRHATARRRRSPPRTGYGGCDTDPPVHLARRPRSRTKVVYSAGSLAEKTNTWSVRETQFTARTGRTASRSAPAWMAVIINAGVKRYRDLNGQHLTTLSQAEVDKETIHLQVETNQSQARVALTAHTSCCATARLSRWAVRLSRSPVSLPTTSPCSLSRGSRV